MEEAETGTVRENLVGKASRKRAKTRKPTAAGQISTGIAGSTVLSKLAVAVALCIPPTQVTAQMEAQSGLQGTDVGCKSV